MRGTLSERDFDKMERELQQTACCAAALRFYAGLSNGFLFTPDMRKLAAHFPGMNVSIGFFESNPQMSSSEIVDAMRQDEVPSMFTCPLVKFA